MSELDETRIALKNLIQGTCNAVGCGDCALKWPKDSDGNSCQSDWLMQKEFELENKKTNL